MLLLMTYPYNCNEYQNQWKNTINNSVQFGGEWIHNICMTESLHCSPETITRLLTDYTPIQNVFGV